MERFEHIFYIRIYMTKRLFDILASLILLLVLSPLLLIITLLVFLSDGHSPFFSQLRVGQNLKNFTLFKFRTMKPGSESSGFRTKSGDDRVTKVGRFLRRLSLDELPQLLNVLQGTMSLVGNRPKVPLQESDYEKPIWHKIHRVKPGITGLAQVQGRSSLTQDLLVKKELFYSEKRTFFLDLNILFLTLINLLTDFKKTNYN